MERENPDQGNIRRKITRRKFLGLGFGAAVIGAATLVGCGSDQKNEFPSTPVVDAPRQSASTICNFPLEATPGVGFYDNQLTVKFNDDVSVQKQAAILTSLEVETLEIGFNGARRIQFEPQKREEIGRVLCQNTNVEFVEPVFFGKPQNK